MGPYIIISNGSIFSYTTDKVTKATETVQDTEIAFHIQHIYLNPVQDLNFLKVY